MHWLKSNGLYDSYSQAITAYANEIGTYQKTYDSVTSLYKTVKNADYGTETVAQLTGEYLFTDEAFVSKLAEHRNLFQRVYDKIRHYYNMAVAGSPEARLLEKAKYTFERAYKTKRFKSSTENSVEYSILKDVNGNAFVNVDKDIFNIDSGESIARIIQKTIKNNFDNIIIANGQAIQINSTTNREFRDSNNARKYRSQDPSLYMDKLRTIENADEIIKAAKNWINESLKHPRTDDITQFARGNVQYRVGQNGYLAEVVVGIRKNGTAVLYDLVNIIPQKITEAPVAMASLEDSQRRQNTSVDEIISQPTFDVNSEFSLTPKESQTGEVMRDASKNALRRSIYGKAPLWHICLKSHCKYSLRVAFAKWHRETH